MSGIRHRFVSPEADGGDATKLRPSNWNDEHVPVGGPHSQAIQLLPGLLCYFDCQEAAGPYLFDKGPYRFVGKFKGPGGVTYGVSGPVSTDNKALTLNGTASLFVARFFGDWNGAYSIGAWLKTTATDRRVLLGTRATSGAGVNFGIGGHGGGGGAGKPYGIVDDGGTALGRNSDSTINDGNWHHIVWTLEGVEGAAVAAGDFKIYVDGTEVSSYSNTGGSAGHPVAGYPPQQAFRLMSNTIDGAINSEWSGDIAHLFVCRYALTSGEISALYATYDD